MSDHRDRGKRIEVVGSREEVVTTLDHFLSTESCGMVGFKKKGEMIELWASSEPEPAT